MSKQNSATKAPTAPKQTAKIPVGSEPLTGVTELVPDALLTGLDQSGRSAQLSDPRLAAIQRQTLAGKMSGQQGNGHLQQMIALARQNQRHAPYQPNTIHKNGAPGAVQRRSQSDSHEAETTVSDEELAALWGPSSEPVVANPEPPPGLGNKGTTLQRADAPAAPADAAAKLPTEEEKAAAKAKAAAAKARAAQTASQGQADASKFQAGKEAEKTAGQSAQQKASESNSNAAKPKGGAAADGAVAAGAGTAAKGRLNGAGIADGAALNGAAGTAANGAAPEKAPASAAEDAAFQGVVASVKGVAEQQQTHAPATAKAKEAQAAAESPASEISGKAQSSQVGEMAAAETPGFNAAAFKEKLMKRIEALTPKNAEDADEFKEQNKAGQLKGDLQNETASQKEQSQAPLAAASEKAPDTGSVPPKPVTPLAPNIPGAAPATPDASGAAPKAKSSAEVEAPMQQQSQQLDQQMAQANVTEEQLAKSNEPEFQSAVSAKEQSQANAQSAPQAYRQDEQATLTQAQGEAGTIAQTQVGAMHGERASVLEQVGGQQSQSKSEDEKKRAEVGAHIQSIYDATKGKVEQILSSLDTEVDQLFSQGAEAAKQTFESFVDAEMEAYKEERYGGWLGWAQWLADKIQPTQPEVFNIFKRGRGEYINAMNAVIDNVVALIGRKLAEAKAAIAEGKLEIQNYVATLDPSLQQVGQEAAQNIQSQFDELTQSVDAKQDQLIDTLANKYNEKLQAIDSRIEQLKAENATLYDKAANLVDGVIKTIQQLKEMMASILARAQSAIELIAADPIGFLGKLIDGVKLGLNNFMGNIGKHLQAGFIGWLTGTMAGAGITLPDNWDAPGIFQLVMQLLDLGFDKIMGKVSQVLGFDVTSVIEPIQQMVELYQAEGFTGLAKMGLERLIGKEHMESLMHVWEILQNVISGNWAALWGMLQEFLGNLKEMVFDKIIEFVTEKVIKGGITWVISLFNPVGAFIKACKAIYDIIMFFVNHGKEIMALVDAVINSVTAIASGNISAAATAIENALARGIPVAIGFLASLLNLGDIGEQVQKIIQNVRGLVEKGLNAVFNSKPVQMVAGFMKKVVGKIKGGIARGVDWAKGKVGDGEEKENGASGPRNGEEKEQKEARQQIREGDDTAHFNPIVIPFAMEGNSHEFILKDQQGHFVITMASQELPLTTKFRTLYTELDDWRHFLEGQVRPKVAPEIQREIDAKIKHLCNIRKTQTAGYQKIYERTFGNRRGEVGHRDPNREREALRDLTDRANTDIELLKKWAQETGMEDLSAESLRNNLRQFGADIFRKILEDRRQRVNDILSSFQTRNGEPVKYRGSLEKGIRGIHKADIRFNTDDFDIDLYVVDPQEHETTIAENPKLVGDNRNAPIPASRATNHMKDLQQQVVSALEASGAVPGIRRGGNFILLRKNKP